MVNIILDLETNNRKIEEVTKLWCICTHDLSKDDSRTFNFTETDHLHFMGYIWALEMEVGKITIIGHNIIAYDIPVLAKMVFNCPVEALYERFNIIDTLVISRVLDPDRNGHALADYAKLFGRPEDKVQYSDWDNFHPIILERCSKDVILTGKVSEYLEKEGKFKI